MLKLTKKDGTFVTSFRTWEEARQYIADEENRKLLPDHPQFGKSYWNFEVLPPDRIRQLLIAAFQLYYNRQVLLDAWLKQVSVVDSCEGNLDKGRQIPLDGRVNLDALREDWCRDYFEDHDFVLSKVEG